MIIQVTKCRDTSTSSDVRRLETIFSFKFPLEYLKFYREYGLAKFGSNEHRRHGEVSVDQILSMKEGENSIANVKQIFEDRFPPGFLPIAACAGGNYLLIGEDGAITFWDHELEVDNNPSAACKIVDVDIAQFLENLVEGQEPEGKIVSVAINPEFAKRMGISMKGKTTLGN